MTKETKEIQPCSIMNWVGDFCDMSFMLFVMPPELDFNCVDFYCVAPGLAAPENCTKLWANIATYCINVVLLQYCCTRVLEVWVVAAPEKFCTRNSGPECRFGCTIVLHKSLGWYCTVPENCTRVSDQRLGCCNTIAP